MAYRVAQLRKNNATTYMTPVEVSATTYESPNKFAEQGDTSHPFTDFALLGNFQNGQVYYLRFLIHRVPDGFYSRSMPQHGGYFSGATNADDMDFTLILLNSENDTEEVIDSFRVDSLATSETNVGGNTIYYARTLVFSPSKTADYLVFRMTRVAYDTLVEERSWLRDADFNTVTRQVYNSNGEQVGTVSTSGARIIYSSDSSSQQDGDISQLHNIMPEGRQKWKKFGYQSRPGSLIVVNKEPIIVGRSGIYEINNGTEITSFMIASPGGSDVSKIDAFLLDYAYEEQDNNSGT